MGYNVMLYGATGFSGRRIAAHGKAVMGPGKPYADCRIILAARDGAKLRKVADENGMEFRVFALDDQKKIRKRLHAIDVIINAAGPFAFTGESLTEAALRAGCHYVDINGELDVYCKLDDLAHR